MEELKVIHSKEYKLIYQTLEQVLSADVAKINIIETISIYALGSYLFLKCCNDIKRCNQDIIFYNEQQFQQKHDHNNKLVQYRFNHLRPFLTQKLNNKRIRIFCNSCSNLLEYCHYHGLKEIFANGSDICHKHPKCALCNKTWKSKKTLSRDDIRCINYGKSCSTIYCWSCVDDYGQEIQCHICCIQQQMNSIKIVLAAMFKGYQYEKLIIQYIAQYSRGYIANCCNNNCNKEIYVDNKFELEGELLDCYYLPPENGGVYVYQIDRIATGKGVNLAGYECRIFCRDCHGNHLLEGCDFLGCSTYDIMMENYFKSVSGYSLKICPQHPICEICKVRQDVSDYDDGFNEEITECYYCKTRFCRFCGISTEELCKNCVILEEYQMIYGKNGILEEDHLIDALGYVLECCFCFGEICIENRWELHQHSTNMRYYHDKTMFNKAMSVEFYGYSWYEISKHQFEEGVYGDVYGMKIRIFCAGCTKHQLSECGKLNCGNMHYNAPGRLCKDHLFCDECGRYISYCNISDENGVCDGVYCDSCIKFHVFNCHCITYVEEYMSELAMYDDDKVFRKVCKPYNLK